MASVPDGATETFQLTWCQIDSIHKLLHILNIQAVSRVWKKVGNRTEAKKKFTQHRLLVVSILNRGYRYQYPPDIKAIDVSMHFLYSLSRSWHEVHVEAKKIFYSNFSALFAGEHFFSSSTAIRLCLIQCITSLTEVVSNLKPILNGKKMFNCR